MFCRFIPCSRKHRRVACIICLFLMIYTLYQLTQGDVPFNDNENGPQMRKWTRREACNALQIRRKLCQDYLNQKIGGNMCKDLCIKDSISFEPICSSKKETTVVLFGKWKNKEIVLKTKRSSHRYKDLDAELAYVFQGQDFSQDPSRFRQVFANHIYEHVLQEIFVDNLRDKISPAEMLRRMYHPYSDKNISPLEMRSLWALLQQEEYIKLQLLRDSIHFPRIYGFCGQYYAIEKVKSLEDFVNIVKLPLPWPKRVDIALELLELIKEFKTTIIGSLSHCDVQPGNFGLAKDGRVVALDVDTVFTDAQMDAFMAQGNCSSNTECTFFDCMSVCNNGQCTNDIVTNNLHVVCHDLFINGWGQQGLLSMPLGKTFAANQLKQYLTQCADGTELPWLSPHENMLLKKIYNLLIKNSRKLNA